MIAGANRDDYHLRNVTPGEDFEPEYLDLRQMTAGDGCLQCVGSIEPIQCIEMAGFEKNGCNNGAYHLYLDRVLTTAAELHHDSDGMALPAAIAPFDVVITPVSITDPTLCSASEEQYESCRKMGLDTLFDDRDERPGVKFKDADLTGIPYRITIGKKLSEGMVEVVERRSKKREDVDKDYAAAFVAGKIRP
jgi:prolyl-tRNA synthetase